MLFFRYNTTVALTGTLGSVGLLKYGDLVEVEIEYLGMLKNQIQANKT